MSADDWMDEEQASVAGQARYQAQVDLTSYYYGWFGDCPVMTVDGDKCGLLRDERGRCWARSRHI